MNDLSDNGAFSADEVAALRLAAAKPVGKWFGGTGSGTSMLKLKAAAAGGPLTADAWAEVREDHAILAAKSDTELAAAFLALEAEQKSASAAAAPTSASAMGGVFPILAVLLTAAASAQFISLGGGCESAYANAKACAEKAQRESGAMQETPLAKYRAAAIQSSAESLKAYDRPEAPRSPIADVGSAAAKLGDADFWKGVKK